MPQDLQPLSSPTPAPRRIGARDIGRRNNAEIHQVLDEVPAGACVCDRDGLITYFNRRAVAIWGREPALHDVRDRFCGSFRLFSRDGAPLAHDQCSMARALSENRECNDFEVVIERPDGRRVTALAHAHPIHDEDGALIGAVNILMDVTDRNRGEQTTSAFLASLGHELRNPLGPVTNAVHILRSKPAPDAQAKWALDLIERQVEDLVCLTDLVSEVSRLAQNSASLECAPFEVAALVAAAEERTRPLLARKGQTCTLTLPSPGAVACGDATRLRRAVESLIQSASRLQRSEETINVCAAVNGAGWTVVAGPRDSDDGAKGPGPHGRLESAGALTPGKWAGLILAERIAELHGGTLGVQVRRDGRLGYELSLPLHPPSTR